MMVAKVPRARYSGLRKNAAGAAIDADQLYRYLPVAVGSAFRADLFGIAVDIINADICA